MGIAQAFQPTFSPAPLVKSDETFTRANREFSLSERFAPYSKLSLPVFLPLSLPTTLLSLSLSILFPPSQYARALGEFPCDTECPGVRQMLTGVREYQVVSFESWVFISHSTETRTKKAHTGHGT